MCACASACACVRACVRVCACVCVCACVHVGGGRGGDLGMLNKGYKPYLKTLESPNPKKAGTVGGSAPEPGAFAKIHEQGKPGADSSWRASRVPEALLDFGLACCYLLGAL